MQDLTIQLSTDDVDESVFAYTGQKFTIELKLRDIAHYSRSN